MHRHKNAYTRPTPEGYLCMNLLAIYSAWLLLQYALLRFYLIIMHHLCISVGRNAAAPILKKLFPLICIMRFCKKEKLKSANMYASIYFIFMKILRSLVF